MNQTKQYPAVVQEIHREFFTASEKLLAEAKEHLQKVNIEKAKRLHNAGFTNSIEVAKLRQVSVSDETAKWIELYSVKYPNNKFIDKKTVDAICNKYNLVCAPIDRYKGFVPQEALDKTEAFSVKSIDRATNGFIIKKAWSVSSMLGNRLFAKKVHRVLGFKSFPIDKYSTYSVQMPNGESAYITEYEMIDNNQMLICAPKKDMQTKGLKKIGVMFLSATTVTVPDPVVLQPVKGGYLIVAAWGDEASDELVVNPKSN